MRTTIGVAIDIPPPWGELLTRRRAESGDPQAAFVPAHLTLLGPTDVAVADLPDIDRGLAELAAGYPPFTLHLRGTGTFRPLTEVVFVAVAAGISECELLAQGVRGVVPEPKPLRFPYHPHITVAMDVTPEALDAVFTDLADFEAKFPVASFTLFRHGDGGRWHPERDYPLAGPTDQPLTGSDDQLLTG